MCCTWQFILYGMLDVSSNFWLIYTCNFRVSWTTEKRNQPHKSRSVSRTQVKGQNMYLPYKQYIGQKVRENQLQKSRGQAGQKVQDLGEDTHIVSLASKPRNILYNRLNKNIQADVSSLMGIYRRSCKDMTLYTSGADPEHFSRGGPTLS